MPIIDKRDQNNWYNCIHLAYQDEYNPLTDPYFNPETCPESEFRYRNGNVIAKPVLAVVGCAVSNDAAVCDFEQGLIIIHHDRLVT